MRSSSFRQIQALGLGAALVGWSFVVPRLQRAWRVLAQAGVGGLLVLVTRAQLGVCPPRLSAGLRWGSAVGVVAAAAIATVTRVPAVRQSMATRELPDAVPAWLAWQIPLGTVWAEEAAYRAALATAGAAAFGPARGQLLQAGAFGLSHVVDARATGASPVATVLATGVGGWLFGWLAVRSASLVAPMVVHLTINEAGAVAALMIQRSRAPGR